MSVEAVLMRSSLRWALFGTVSLSVLALWLPGPSAGESAGAASAAQASPVPSSEVLGLRQAGARASATHSVQRFSLDKARADPFSAVQTVVDVPKKEPAPAPVAALPPAVVAVPVNTPPALSYRYLGQMTDPTGNQLVYLSKPGQDLRVTVGATLDEGYVVEAIAEDGVRLHHPATDTRAVVAIPRAVAGGAP
jgi:hypothetical protein